MPKVIVEPSSPAERAQADARRRKSDGVDQIANGFCSISHGRDGMIYYREGDRLLELYFELNATGPGILVYTAGLDNWVLPTATAVSTGDRSRIGSAFDAWARTQPVPMVLVAPEDLIRPWEDTDPGTT